MVSQEQIKSLILRKDELYKFIDIEGKQIEANALEAESQQNKFWNNINVGHKNIHKMDV